MSVQVRALIKNFINTYIIPNGNNLITGAQANSVLNDLADSLIHRIDDIDLLGLKEYKSTRTYVLGECCVRFGSIYQSSLQNNINHPPESSQPYWNKLTDANSLFYSFPPWDNAEVYAIDDTVRYQDRLWRAIQAGQGQAPATGSSYWIEVSASRGGFGEPWVINTIYPQGTVVRKDGWLYEMQLPNYYSASFAGELSVGVWKAFAQVAQMTYAALMTELINSRIAPMRTYYLTDKRVFIKGVDRNNVDPNGLHIAENPDNQKIGNYSTGFGTYRGAWTNVMVIATGEVVERLGKYYRNITGDNLGAPEINTTDFQPVNLGKWRISLIANAGDVVIWNGIHYKNLTGVNSIDPPHLDPSTWQAVPNGSVTYATELDACFFHIESGNITQRLDKRGNIIGSKSIVLFNSANPIPYFDWGNDLAYNNRVESGRLIGYNNNGTVKNCVVRSESTLDLDTNDGLIDNLWVDKKTSVLACKNAGVFFKNSILASGDDLTTHTDFVTTEQVFKRNLSQDNINITTTESNFRAIELNKITLPVGDTVFDVNAMATYCRFNGYVEITSTGDMTINDIVGFTLVNSNFEFVYREFKVKVTGMNVIFAHGFIQCPDGSDLLIKDGGFVVFKSQTPGSGGLIVVHHQNFS